MFHSAEEGAALSATKHIHHSFNLFISHVEMFFHANDLFYTVEINFTGNESCFFA